MFKYSPDPKGFSRTVTLGDEFKCRGWKPDEIILNELELLTVIQRSFVKTGKEANSRRTNRSWIYVFQLKAKAWRVSCEYCFPHYKQRTRRFNARLRGIIAIYRYLRQLLWTSRSRLNVLFTMRKGEPRMLAFTTPRVFPCRSESAYELVVLSPK